MIRALIISMAIVFTASHAQAQSHCTIFKTWLVPATAGATHDYLDMVDHSKSSTELLEDSLIAPIDMQASNLYAEVITAPGSGDTWRITLRDDGASTSLTCDITGTEQTCIDDTNTPSIEAGSRLNLWVDSSQGATDPTSATYMMLSFCLEGM